MLIMQALRKNGVLRRQGSGPRSRHLGSVAMTSAYWYACLGIYLNIGCTWYVVAEPRYLFLHHWIFSGPSTTMKRCQAASNTVLHDVASSSLRFCASEVCYNTFITSTGNVIQCSLKMPLWIVHGWRGIRCCRIGVYQLNQAIDVLSRDLIEESASGKPFVAWYEDENLQLRSPGRRSRRIGSGSRRRARQKQQRPYTRRQHGVLVVDIPAHACRLDIAA